MLAQSWICTLIIFSVLKSVHATDSSFCKFNQGNCPHPHGYVQDYGYGGFTSKATEIAKNVSPIKFVTTIIKGSTNSECTKNIADPVTTGAAKMWNGSASPASMVELEGIQCAGEKGKSYKVGSKDLSTLVHTVSEMDSLQEELVFLTAIDNVRQFNDCQDGLYRGYFNPKSSVARTEMLSNAWTQFREINEFLRPKLIEELKLRETKGKAEKEMNCRKEGGCGQVNAQTIAAIQEYGNGLDSKINGMRKEINTVLSRIPMANRDSMRAAIENLLLSNGPITKDQFNNVFDTQMHQLDEGVQKTKSYLGEITVPAKANSSERLYCIDRNLKEQLYHSGQIDHTVKQMGAEDVLKNFSLRSQNRYGMAGTVISEVALIPTYFVGYGVARLAVRAGASSVRAIATSGRALSSVSRLAMLGMEGVDYGSAIHGALADCSNDVFTAEVDGKTCDPKKELGQAYEEASMAQCLTSSILPFASPLVGTSVRLANSKGLKKLYAASIPSNAVNSQSAPNLAPGKGGISDWFRRLFNSDTSPIHTPATVSQQDVLDTRRKFSNQLQIMGVETYPIPWYNKSTYLRANVLSFKETQLTGTSPDKADYGTLLEVVRLPKPSSSRGPQVKALLHPDMPKYMKQMKDWGYDLVVDTSIPHTGAGAYQWSHTKVIALQPDSDWQTFIHEFQHLEFDQLVKPRFKNLQEVSARGDSIHEALPIDVVKALGEKRVDRLKQLLDRGMPELGINETLSVDAELALLGFKRYLPFNGSRSRRYAVRHQITELENVQNRSAIQEKTLRDLRLENNARLAYEASPMTVANVGMLGAVALVARPMIEDFMDDTVRVVYDSNGTICSQSKTGVWRCRQEKEE